MVFVNYTAMHLTVKIVYYGPGLGGKTTNLRWIHGKTAPGSRGDMVSLETEADRTLFFDLLPLDVGMIGAMKVRLQLYTVPGQVFYNATRRLVLKGVDGIVFVADSQVAAREPNRESLANLVENLEELGLDPRSIPTVFQYNKRDLPSVLPVDTLEKDLNPRGAPAFEAAAIHGTGVFETLKDVTRRAIESVRTRLAEGSVGYERRGPGTAPHPPIPGERMPPTVLDGVHDVSASPAPGAAAPKAGEATAAPPPPAPGPHLEIQFADEETEKPEPRPKPRVRGPIDIGREIEKLRTMTEAVRRDGPSSGTADVDRLFRDLLAGARATEQDLERRLSVEVPEHLLKGLTDLRIHLGFDRDGREEIVRDAARVSLQRSRRLQRLRLRLDLDLKGKG
jgi:signal recognition particle receptor subunit beta